MKNIQLWLGAGLVALLASGCVYYNTFFNARQAFNEAEGYRKKTGVGTQSGYKTAIDKALKVIEDHPNSKYYDDALYVLGVSYFYSQQYNKAERRLRELLADFPKSKYVPEGTVYLARAKLKTGAPDEAIAMFEEIFQGKFSRELRADAAMALGDYQAEQKDQPQALRYYMAVRDSLGDEEQRLEAQRFIADGYFEQYKFSDALKGYLQVLGLKPDHNERYHALYQAAVCSYRLQRVRVGMDYLQQLAKDPLYFDSLGAISLAMGEGHEESGDLQSAEGVYQDIAMTSKNNLWIGEAYYRIGLIYQFDYDDANEAKKYYDKASRASGGTPSGQDAAARSTDIGKLQALTKAGLDTAAVRMAQEGLDSLPPDSIDYILEMRLPPPDTTKKVDSTLKDTTLHVKDSAATPVAAARRNVEERDAAGLARRDSLARVSDSLKLRDTTSQQSAVPVPGVPSPLKAADSASVKQPVADTTRVKDSTAVTPPVPVSSPKDSTQIKPVDSTVAVKKDTSKAVQAAPKEPAPKLVPDTTHKTVDTAMVKKPDSSGAAAALGLSPGLMKNSIAPGIDTTTRHDSAATPLKTDSIGQPAVPAVPDSLARKDTSKVVPVDTTHVKKLDTTAASLKAGAKNAKDTSLTPAQIWKRINDAAESQYSLAELYWFQLDKPDSAIKELTDLLQMFPKSERAPQAMIALSQMYRDSRGDTATADSLLHQVLVRYPHSDDVPQALEALGLRNTPADTGYAEYYLRRAESFLFDQNDPDSARYYYRYVARNFPRSRFRDQAAFGAVWVVENYESKGDSAVYYAYKRLAQALPNSPFQSEASKRLTYVAPPPVKKPADKDKERQPMTRADSLMAQGPNMVGNQADSSAPAYVDPLKAVYVGPKKEELVLLEIQPVTTNQEFVYPQEAYDLDGNQFLLYFQVLLDVTGRVIDEVLKIPSSSDELNKRAELTVRSMTFDPLEVQKELQRKAINLILPEEQADPRGRWYVFKYTVSKPGFISK